MLHAALTTALSLLQSQPTIGYAPVPSSSSEPYTPSKKKPPPPEQAVQVFDARQAMLDELKKKIAARQKHADVDAITNY